MSMPEFGTLTPIPGCQILHRITPERNYDTNFALTTLGKRPIPAPTAGQFFAGGCPDIVVAALHNILTAAFDVVGGRRPLEILDQLPLKPLVRSSFQTRAKTNSLPGAALKSIHPSPSYNGAVVAFIGTFVSANRARAFAGTMRTTRNRWMVESLKII